MRPGRPKCPRRVEEEPPVTYFKPRGVPLSDLKVVTLSLEELEAVRLTDLEGMEQQVAANMMGVSRRALWADLRNARRKIVDALVHGMAIEIAGGQYVLAERPGGTCQECRSNPHLSDPDGGGSECPKCGRGRLRDGQE